MTLSYTVVGEAVLWVSVSKNFEKKIKTGLDKIRSQNGGSSKQSLIAIPNMGKAHSQLSQGSPFFPKCPYADTVL